MRRVSIVMLLVSLLLLTLVGCGKSTDNSIIANYTVGPQSGQFWTVVVYPGKSAEAGKIYRLAAKVDDTVCRGYIEWSASDIELSQGVLVTFTLPSNTGKISVPSKIVVEATATLK